SGHSCTAPKRASGDMSTVSLSAVRITPCTIRVPVPVCARPSAARTAARFAGFDTGRTLASAPPPRRYAGRDDGTARRSRRSVSRRRRYARRVARLPPRPGASRAGDRRRRLDRSGHARGVRAARARRYARLPSAERRPVGRPHGRGRGDVCPVRDAARRRRRDRPGSGRGARRRPRRAAGRCGRLGTDRGLRRARGRTRGRRIVRPLAPDVSQRDSRRDARPAIRVARERRLVDGVGLRGLGSLARFRRARSPGPPCPVPRLALPAALRTDAGGHDPSPCGVDGAPAGAPSRALERAAPEPARLARAAARQAVLPPRRRAASASVRSPSPIPADPAAAPGALAAASAARRRRVTPHVTVLMPVRNGGGYLRGAVASILGQTFEDFELLVVDDGSDDGSDALVESFGDPRIRLVRNGSPLGLVASLNRGLAEARGAYVARADADDECLPDRLALQVPVLDAEPQVGVVGGWAELVD